MGLGTFELPAGFQIESRTELPEGHGEQDGVLSSRYWCLELREGGDERDVS